MPHCTQADRDFASKMRSRGIDIDPEDLALARESGSPFSHTREPAPRWNESDLIEAHGEVLAALTGVRRPVVAMHPLAAEALANGRTPSMIDLAKAFAVQKFGGGARGWDVRTVLNSGVVTEHLGDLWADTANRQVISRAPDLSGTINAVCRDVPLNNFLASRVGTVELGVGIEEAANFARPWQTIAVSGSAEEMALRLSPIRLRIAQQAIVNDDIRGIVALIDALATACAQNELAALAGLLNNAQTLADGSAWIHADYANRLAGQSKDIAAVNGAVALLRSQTVNAKATDADPATLLVPAADEATARKLVRESSGAADWFNVRGTSYLSAGYWYLFADPQIWPAIARGIMRGAEATLSFTRGTPRVEESAADVIEEAQHVFDLGVVSRVGLVRIEVS